MDTKYLLLIVLVNMKVLGSVPVRCYGIANTFIFKIHRLHDKVTIS